MSSLKDTNPDVYEFLNTPNNGLFADNVGRFFRTHGFITANQLNACKKILVNKNANSYATRKDSPDSELKIILDTAYGNGLDSPKLRIQDYEFSRAKNTSSNPGAVYVSKDGLYIGKIIKMNFLSSGNVDQDTRNDIETILNSKDIPKLVIQYGLNTGICSCCGRTLSNKESIRLGIGPICNAKFGF